MNNGFHLFMKEAARQDSSTARIPKVRWLTFEQLKGHSGGIPVDPDLMGYIRIPYNWKEYVFHRVVLSASNLSLRTD